MTILVEFGVENRLEKEDYLQGLQNLQKRFPLCAPKNTLRNVRGAPIRQRSAGF
jgi:hypothetical protein